MKYYNFNEVYEDEMDFSEVYEDLINFRINNKLIKSSKSIENHHINPKFLGGNNDSSNLILLYSKEHFMAHYFMMKIYDLNSIEYEKCFLCFQFMMGKIKLLNNEIDIIYCSSIYDKERNNYLKILEGKGKESLLELCGFIKVNKRYPKNSKEEKRLYNLFDRFKKAKNNKREYIYFESYDYICKLYNLQNIFDYVDKKELMLYNISQICEFYNNYNKIPSRTSSDLFEKKLGNLLNNIKSKKSLDDNIKNMINCYNCENIFFRKYINENKTISTNEMFEWIELNGIPKPSSNGYEKSVYNRMDVLKRNRRGNSWDKKNDIEAIRVGYPMLFFSEEENVFYVIEKICEFYKTHNKNPSRYSSDNDEKLLYYKFNSMRNKMKGNKMKEVYKNKIKELNIEFLFKGE